MAVEQSNSGLDLHVDVSGHGLRDSLERQLREAVRAGRLMPGSRLPASRALAADLGVSRQTVAGAYDQLVAEGWLVARQGSGTRVADTDQVRPSPASDGSPPARGARFSLLAGSPDLSSFPRAEWARCAQQALRDAPASSFGYGDPRGLPVLRAALASYLGRVRGVHSSADRIVVCSGFTQGLALLCRALSASGGQSIGYEELSIGAHRDVAAANGLVPMPIPIDDEGADLTSIGDAAAAVLTPAHQFPTGVVLSPARRRAAVGWAERRDAVIVEDDYDGEFRYDRQPVGAMQALAPHRVVCCGTTSKTLAPALRLGWLVVPERLVDSVVEAKRTSDGQTHLLDQLTLARFIESGGYDRHVRRARLVYRRRRNAVVDALASADPSIRVSGVAAGLHLVASLPAGLTERAAIERAAARGLVVHGLGAFTFHDDDGHDGHDGRTGRDPSLVVGYAAPAEHAFTGALARLTAALAT